jgi:hypothetical protein
MAGPEILVKTAEVADVSSDETSTVRQKNLEHIQTKSPEGF